MLFHELKHFLGFQNSAARIDFYSTQDASRSRKYVIYCHSSVIFVLDYFKECKITVVSTWMEYFSRIVASHSCVEVLHRL